MRLLRTAMRLAVVTAAHAVAAAALWWAAGSPPSSIGRLLSAAAGLDDLLGSVLATAAWLGLGWSGLLVSATAAAAGLDRVAAVVPGLERATLPSRLRARSARVVTAVLSRVAPATARRMAAIALGISLAGGTLAAPALAAPPVAVASAAAAGSAQVPAARVLAARVLALAAAPVAASPTPASPQAGPPVDLDRPAPGPTDLPTDPPLDLPVTTPAASASVPSLDRPVLPESPPGSPGGFLPAPPPVAPRVTDAASVSLVESPPVRRPPERADTGYVVRRGDSLWAIVRRHLGAQATDADVARAWPDWYAANRSLIGPDPGRLYPGQRLCAPASAPPLVSAPTKASTEETR